MSRFNPSPFGELINAFNFVSFKDARFGSKGDGTTDDTQAFQSALNFVAQTGACLYVPKPISKYKIGKIVAPSGFSMFIEEGTVFEAVSGAFPNTTDKMLDFTGQSNIYISGYGATFQMLKNEYTSGEERHVFNLHGVTNVYIEGVSANDSGGDGFYVGWNTCENVWLVDVKATNNRRNNVSVTNGRNIHVIRPVLSNANGTAPQAGLDIEAEGTNPIFEGVRVVSPRTSSNVGPGIQVVISALVNTGVSVDVDIADAHDEGSDIAVQIYGANGVANGVIRITKPYSNKAQSNGIAVVDYDSRNPVVIIDHPTVEDCNQYGYTDTYKYDSGICVLRDTGSTQTSSSIGNVHIVRPNCIDSRATKAMSTAIFIKDYVSDNVVSCSIIDPIRLEYKDVALDVSAINLGFSDVLRVSSISDTYTGGISINGYGYHRYRDNTGATASVIYNLDANAPVGMEVTFTVKATQSMQITPTASDQIFPLTTTAGKYVTSNTIGSRIAIKKIDVGKWFVTEQIGTWTSQ